MSEGGFEALFAQRRQEGRLALLPWLMAGYPSPDLMIELVAAMAEAGADGFEVSVPFSDPIADGPTVQRANQHALDRGVTPADAIGLVARARARVDRPIALMGYFNPILRYGLDRYCRDAEAAGASALIVPDLPPEEAAELAEATRRGGLDLVAFVAPTTSPERLKAVGRTASGFIYCVSLTGVTGARAELAEGLDDLLGSIRAVTATPVVVGFGISRPEHVAWLRGRADGAIVASALIDRIERAEGDPVAAAAEFVRALRAAADGAASPAG
ncbi:MAG TPA: tryptophan synthase subunit alpha [Chloroflexota bacterium]